MYVNVCTGLRLSYGQVQRLPRVNRLHTWKYGDWEIPPGVAVGMDVYHMHTSPTIFPVQARTVAGRSERSGRSAPPFQLLGPVRWRISGLPRHAASVHGALCTLFRRHELELFETVRADAEFVLDIVMPMPRWGSKGVRVVKE